MAAILVAAGIAIAQKVEQKKQAKRDKKTLDAARYKDLERETSLRLERTPSGTVLKHYDGEADETAEERTARKERERWERYESRDTGSGRGAGVGGGVEEVGVGGDGRAVGYERVVGGAAASAVGEDGVRERELGSRNPFRRVQSAKVGGLERSGPAAPEIRGFVGQT